ncbi:MAG: GldM family protein [Crocinitomicaceae bacterium]|nr:GldM family protein [Crocinitomicaceae bacterium]
MAGGKETPRQKMIGMMYLVLTALLALNVSKAVLDAFVAIEENIQKANIVQVERGDGYYDAVQEEYSATSDPDQQAKKEKLKYVLEQMDKINAETEEMIKYIDELKMKILDGAGENTAEFSNDDEKTMMWLERDGVRPTRMNLMQVQAKDNYDIPMQIVVGTNEGGEITSIKGEGAILWEKFNQFRLNIVKLAGSYQMNGSPAFSVEPTAINEYGTNAELKAMVTDMIKKSKANLTEDEETLVDLYIMLTRKELNTHHETEDVHWVGMTFDHSPLVAAIASLSSMQQDILGARAIALRHWKSKVTVGEYSFNKIMPLAYGPAVANAGDTVELQVMMVAFDSDNQPKVELARADELGANISYPGNGQGIIKIKAGATTMDLSGTVAIKNKSGSWKPGDWNHTVTIMEPQGSIELPEMNVLYRGYNNQVSATASGYPGTGLTGSGVNISGGGPYVVRPTTTGRTATLIVSGRTADGKSVQLKRVEFRVRNLPTPELYWGGSVNGTRANPSEARLFARYGDEITLNAKFDVLDWECSIPGAVRPIKGTGNTLSSQVISLIRGSGSGGQISFICTVIGPDGTRRKKTGVFKI